MHQSSLMNEDAKAYCHRVIYVTQTQRNSIDLNQSLAASLCFYEHVKTSTLISKIRSYAEALWLEISDGVLCIRAAE